MQNLSESNITGCGRCNVWWRQRTRATRNKDESGRKHLHAFHKGGARLTEEEWLFAGISISINGTNLDERRQEFTLCYRTRLAVRIEKRFSILNNNV